MQFRTSLSLAVVALLLATAAGCRRTTHRSHSSSDDDIFTTDEFPGAPVQNGNVAADQRALSNSGEVASSIVTWFNGDRGTAMVTYVTAGPGLVAPYHPYAHYYDGSTWTPPVALQALDTDLTAVALPCGVAFLNTEEHASASAQERNGDAIVLWLATDFDGDGAEPADGANFCLFATYFDVTHAFDAGHRYGFEEYGTRLTVSDKVTENSTFPAIISDGCRGQNSNFATLGNKTPLRYGDQTTGIVVAWPQREDNDPVTAGFEDTSIWYAHWDLAAGSDPEIPLAPSASSRLPIDTLGASDSGLSSEETLVDGILLTYNNLLFFRVAADQDPTSGAAGNNVHPLSLTVPYGFPFAPYDDVVIQEVAFNLASGSPGTPEVLALGTPDATDVYATQMMYLYATDSGGGSVITPSLYGSDEGLAQCLFTFVELDADPDPSTFGSGTQDGYLEMLGLDESTGAIQSGVLLSLDDPTIFDTVLPTNAYTQISRNGDYIWVAWLQPDAAGASDDLALKVAQVVTTRPDEDGAFTLPVVSLATSVTQTPEPDIDGYDVTWFAFQAGLGYVCGAQSDPDVMNLYCEHSDATQDRVIQFRLTADHVISPVPSVSSTLVDTFEDGEMTAAPINFDLTRFGAVDAGSDGDAVAFYIQDVSAGATTDRRLFARRLDSGLEKVEIGSGLSARQVRNQDLRLVVTPAGSEIGTLDTVSMEDSPARPHPAEFVHVFFHEDKYESGSATAPAIRTRVLDLTEGSGTLGSLFTPTAGASFLPPFEFDIPGIDPDPAHGADIRGVAREENTLGVWFIETGHIWYQEFDAGERSWRVQDGVSDPWLVDDDSPVDAESPVFGASPTVCEYLHGAMIFWLKDLDGSEESKRYQVRIRE